MQGILQTTKEKKVSPHSFRTAWVTRLKDGGAPDKAILIEGGWSSYKSMMDIYLQDTQEAHEKLLQVNNLCA